MLSLIIRLWINPSSLRNFIPPELRGGLIITCESHHRNRRGLGLMVPCASSTVVETDEGFSLNVSNANAWLTKPCAQFGGRLAARASAETSSYGLRYLPVVLGTMHTQPITSTVSRKSKGCFPLCSGSLRCALVSSSKPATGIFKRPSCRNRALGRQYRWIAVDLGLPYMRMGSSRVEDLPAVTS